MDKMASINMVACAFGAKADDQIMTLWAGLLSPYDDNAVYRAAVALIRKTTDAAYGRMPLFGLMQQELDALSSALHGGDNVELQAEAEWGKLLEALEEYGSYREPTNLDKTTAQVVRLMGGWLYACSWMRDDLPFRHRDFVKLWAQTHGREDAVALGADGVRALNGTKGIEAVQRLAIEEGN